MKNHNCCKKGAGFLMGLSFVTLILAAFVSITQADYLWLAGTQWILVSILLAIYALVFDRHDNCERNDRPE